MKKIIVLCGKHLEIDNCNLRNKKLAFASENNNHHFTLENAIKATTAVNKRPLTNEENIALCRCKNYWDPIKEGRVFIVPTPSGDYTKIFLPAAGYRGPISGSLLSVGTNGNYWSASPYGSESVYGSGLYFSSTIVYVLSNTHRADGRSVRCVREIK